MLLKDGIVSAPIGTDPSEANWRSKSRRGDLPFGSSGGKERPTEAPCPTTATANAQAGLESIAGIAAKKKYLS